MARLTTKRRKEIKSFVDKFWDYSQTQKENMILKTAMKMLREILGE